MNISIFDRAGTTVQARYLPADTQGPALRTIKVEQLYGIEVTWFLNAGIALQLRAALEELFPVGGQPITAPDDAAEWDRLAEYADAQADVTVANN